uniref:LRR receptor-like serine/threonine-protein kinase GSO2 n=1 Tax=Erigeron canadensis TaxID=72917 RepID=UPI001CB88F17|nr:LRR receptor-like serine/threonine-protein kinase GSO2 [Erigeron canadensis]
MKPYFLVLLFFILSFQTLANKNQENPISELKILLKIKSFLDPKGQTLTSWSPDAKSYCDGSFEGIACNEFGKVMNISLQGKGLFGQIPPEIGDLKSLSGLYLHFNGLHGEIPKEIGELTQLTDLYLNVNNLSGEIPTELQNMANLQVLQLCYNHLSGSLPPQLGSLKKLNVLAVQYNQLSGAIPATLGDVGTLQRLDLSFNRLFGSIPMKIADAPLLQVLDVRNNTLSGNVPLVLKKLDEGFQYANNSALCGSGFADLNVCNSSFGPENPDKPEPFGPQSKGLTPKAIPQSANVVTAQSKSKSSNAGLAAILGAVVTTMLLVAGLFSFVWYRRRKQRIGTAFETSDSRISTDQYQVKEIVNRRSASPLISLEYSNGWDPMSKSQTGSGFLQEVLESFMFNVDDVESATRFFSDSNLLGKSSFSATYKGILRDGSIVAIKRITKTSCISDETEFLKGLKILTSLKHENLVRLRGFCCSKGRGECFLIYDYVAKGNLLRYLDVKGKSGSGNVLDWSTRFSIIKGIAKGIEYLHGIKGKKPGLVHQNISAEKVLIDQNYTPLLSGSGLHKLLADDIIFSTLKGSAAMGYLAPEYTTTGRFTEKSDIYAFGMLIFQIISGKTRISLSIRQAAELCKFQEFVDANLDGKFSEPEAIMLGKIALLCTHELPGSRPTIETVTQELSNLGCTP